jgi:two-component system CheB/CheR fusion protein
MKTKKEKSRSQVKLGSSANEEKPKGELGKGKAEGAFYIVGMGGSAGALEAFEQFFHNLPSDSGMAFVLVPHLDPTHKGIMPELLQRLTPMKVLQVKDGMKVQPNMVYVIPPNKDMAILHGCLQLLEPSAPRGLRLPIDFFFRNLAEDQKEWSIGIILSGMGTDGTLGLKAIKEQMGMAMVQEPSSAKYDSMPRSAIDTGLVDYIAPAEELPGKLTGYVSHFSKVRTEVPPVEKKTLSALQKILILLRAKTGNDFSLYKKNTILRRLDRRMSLHHITSMSHYASYLQEKPHEIDLLFKELLIGVTNYFRDPEAFDILKEKAILPLFKSKKADSVVRVWIPGCSTGEEAYSIAILFRECMSAEPGVSIKVQVYATDIDLAAIAFARLGLYPANIGADVSPERLQRYFIKEDASYRVKKEIRELVVFAPQNIALHPPFTRLDLLSCRNLLIYLTPELQKKLIPLLHYALNASGYLFLGPSESVSAFSDLFATVDGKWKIFSRRESASALLALPEFPSIALPLKTSQPNRGSASIARSTISFPDIIQRVIVESVSPPVVIISEKGDLLYSTQRTGKYFEPSVGRANFSVFEMAREGLKIDLAVAVRRAIKERAEIVVRGLIVKTNGDSQTINLTVRPFVDSAVLNDLLMLVFEEIPPATAKRRREAGSDQDTRHHSAIVELEKELQYTKEHLQTTIEEMETSQEELKSTNEELQSTNEELQSTNEELTTSQEELQSLNEELLTVNVELQSKNEELARANNDMRNLLNSTQIPTLFLDNTLRIKRFTTPATKIFTLISSDIGRPVTDIATRLQYEGFVKDVQEVLDLLAVKEQLVQSKDERWYLMRMMPYRTMENLIDGVVITFNDLTEFKKLERLWQGHDQIHLLAMVVDNSNDAIIVQDLKGGILAWNNGAERMYGWSEAEAIGRLSRDWISEPKVKEYESFINRLMAGEYVSTFETQRITKKGGLVDVWLAATILKDDAGAIKAIATMERDITELRKTEAARQEGEQNFLATLNDLPVMLVAFDVKKNVVFWNRVCERVTGWTAAEMINNSDSLKRLFHDNVARHQFLIKSDKSRDGEKNRELRLKCKDGSIKTITWSGSVIENPLSGWAEWATGIEV